MKGEAAIPCRTLGQAVLRSELQDKARQSGQSIHIHSKTPTLPLDGSGKMRGMLPLDLPGWDHENKVTQGSIARRTRGSSSSMHPECMPSFQCSWQGLPHFTPDIVLQGVGSTMGSSNGLVFQPVPILLRMGSQLDGIWQVQTPALLISASLFLAQAPVPPP